MKTERTSIIGFYADKMGHLIKAVAAEEQIINLVHSDCWQLGNSHGPEMQIILDEIVGIRMKLIAQLRRELSKFRVTNSDIESELSGLLFYIDGLEKSLNVIHANSRKHIAFH